MPNFKIPPPPPPPNFKFPNNKVEVEQKNIQTTNSQALANEKTEPIKSKKKLSEKSKKALFFFLGALCFASSIVMFTLMFVL